MVTWITPTGHNDPDAVWTDETNAYDDDTATDAYATLAPSETSGYLELTHSGVGGDVIRFHLSRGDVDIAVDQIEVEYGGAWHTVATAPSITWDAWNEFSLGSWQTMTGVRIRFYNGGSWDLQAYVNEADFGETPQPGPGQMLDPTSKSW